ncbi:MAG TPA: DUF3109 family protein [Tenuifilaceae bacterium]|nr:DUF3109 family protein [Tenuifilaceae bacterium]HPE19460.1 DUF3109 family protein [Tenuifilaceae bacterium]HPJ47030.1 DUF3109 family protein [Tenuifilaceae bacterium]HPQ35549.1 DUF3109 family protein [Tenuifilaceae bacterium]HRX69276.1 DUF3109 family protein [Tenuifilaceae bacterium]
MIQIDDKLISFDIFEKSFCCDLPKCLGTCCVHGQSGAPLESYEVELLKKELPRIEPYLKPSGLESIKKQGVAVNDLDGDLVTPLIDEEECAYSYEDNGVTFCAIEKGWMEGNVKFRKPISCHLYPIRAKKYSTFTALNYDQWSICQPARELGEQMGLPVYKFLKEPIIRAFGDSFYTELEAAAKLLEESKEKNDD